MKRYFIIVLFIIFIVVACTGDKINSGDLSGTWKAVVTNESVPTDIIFTATRTGYELLNITNTNILVSGERGTYTADGIALVTFFTQAFIRTNEESTNGVWSLTNSTNSQKYSYAETSFTIINTSDDTKTVYIKQP